MINLDNLQRKLSATPEARIPIRINPMYVQDPLFLDNYSDLVSSKIAEDNWGLDQDEKEEKEENESIKSESIKSESIKSESIKSESILSKEVREIDKLNELNELGEGVIFDGNQQSDLPPILTHNWSNGNNYYLKHQERGDSYLASILSAVDDPAQSKYNILNKKEKKNYQCQVKFNIAIQLTNLWKIYSTKEFKVGDLRTELNDNIDSELSRGMQYILGIYFKTNILVLCIQSLEGNFPCSFNSEWDTLVLFYDQNAKSYYPMISCSSSSSLISSNDIKQIEKSYNIVYPVLGKKSVSKIAKNKKETKSEIAEKKEETNPEPVYDIKDVLEGKSHRVSTKIKSVKHVELESITTDDLMAMTRYSLKQLQEIAGKLSVKTEYPLEDGDDPKKKKKKPKKVLYTEILLAVTKLEQART